MSLVAVTLMIDQVSTQGWGGALPLGCFAVAVLAGVVFVMRERVTDEPAVPLEMFRSRAFVTGNLLVLIGSGLMFAV